MASFEDELLLDAEDNARAIAYIRQYLPQEVKEKFTDEDLYYFLDLIYEYYSELKPDADGFIEIDEMTTAKHLEMMAKKEMYGEFSAEDLIFVVQGESGYADNCEA